MEKERWIKLKNRNYYISNYGRLLSGYCSGSTIIKSNEGKIIHGRLMKLRSNHSKNKPYGYLMTILNSRSKNAKHVYIHRLVAKYFVPNPSNYDCVNHKDANHFNNMYTNLEWCSYSYNNKHAYKIGAHHARKGNKISCYSTRTGLLIDTYRSMREAERVNKMGNGNVSMAIKNGWNYHGYFWSKSDSLKPEEIFDLIKSQNIKYKTKKSLATSKAVNQFTLDGKYIRTYSSYNDAAKQFNSKGSQIGRVVNNGRKTFKGFLWEKAD